MTNPFEVIESRLSNIESLLLDIKHNPPTSIGDCKDEELLTVPQIAEYLTLSIHYVYKLISRGELPVMKRGKRVYASKADLFAYLKEGRKLTNSEIERKADLHIANRKRSKV